MWNMINNVKDVEYFMELFGNFHDSCIKEFKYVSGAYVNEDLMMNPINTKRKLKVVFQRTTKNVFAIEMEFDGLIQLNICPQCEENTCEILDVTFEICEQGFAWYDSEPLTQEQLVKYEGTKIISSAVRWRIANEFLGEKEVYC